MVVSLIGDGIWGERLRLAGIEVVNLRMRRGRLPSPAALLRLVRLMRALRPAVVQTWMYHADLLGIVAAQLARRPPVIWNLRCSDLDFARYGPLTGRVVRALASLSRWPSMVLANSEAGQRWHAQLGYRPRQWALLPNGIDVEAFRPDPEARRAWRARLEVAEETLLIGMAARRDPMKDHEGLLKAMAQVQSDVACVLVGEGVEASDPILPRLAAESGKSVRFLGHCNDLPGFMAALDISVLNSSFGEGFSNVVAEAMSCGVPVIATDVGDTRKIVADAGIIIPPNDIAALACAIAALALSPAERARLGNLARSRVIAHFALPVVAARYHALWAQVGKSGVVAPDT